ncbi:hypothetical protein, partial [Mucilaginibacter flavus]|uniref:hypothetical protein n=1 Tax=Mucilaginibacter flavus TaxID=931504 RepID=UPI0025B30B30
MADQKSLKAYWEEFFVASAKVSELNRNLSLGGIAIIWIFNKSSLIGSPNFKSLLPKDLLLPSIIIGDSVELDHHIPAQADHPFRAKLTSAFR